MKRWLSKLLLNKNWFYWINLGEVDIRLVKYLIQLCFQVFILFGLFVIGNIFSDLFVDHYQYQYKTYSLTHSQLVDRQIFSINNCSNLTDLPCSLQMYINVYFLSIRFLLLYYLLIIIGMIYIWHSSVRFSYCILTYSILVDIIFRSDLIYYFDDIVRVTYSVCFQCIFFFPLLEGFMPHKHPDPLHALCERIILPHQSNECLLHGNSKRARFYQWTKSISEQWNIKDEKLIVTLILGLITSVITITFLT